MATAGVAVPFMRATDFKIKGVRWAFPPKIPVDWTKEKIDDEMRENGVKLRLDLGGYDLLNYIGFEMELSPIVARGKFTVNEKASETNGQLMRGVVDYIAESIASAAGSMSSESRRIAGVELNLNHLRPAYIGQEVTAIATALRQAKAYQVWEVKFGTENVKESTAESNANPHETSLISIGSFTLVNENSRGVKELALRSKL